ncbi:MAG: hypothetical protein WAL66_05140 [Nitrososphaeraceae archaeon]
MIKKIMTASDDNAQPKENLFEIMDGIIDQLNRTKKMFIIMILSIMIIPPISFVVSFALLGPPFPVDRMVSHERFGHGFGFGFATVRAIPFLISVIWLGIGVRQWFVLSSWTKKYRLYREMQSKIDEKLDFDQNKK